MSQKSVWNVVLHTAEVLILGIIVTMLGGAIDHLANYHPTGEAATVWGMVGLLVTGALKGLYSDLIRRQKDLDIEDDKTLTDNTGMKKMMLLALCGLMLTLGGCAAFDRGLNQFAPNQVDASGNPIPGTHTATAATNTLAGMIPYGGYVLSALLLATNIYQKIASDKTKKALNATIVAIDKAKADPSTAAVMPAVVAQLSTAHEAAGVTQEIKNVIANVT